MNIKINDSGNIEVQWEPGEGWTELSYIEPNIDITTSTSSNDKSWWTQYINTSTVSWAGSAPVYYYPDPVNIKVEEPIEEIKLVKLDIAIEDLL